MDAHDDTRLDGDATVAPAWPRPVVSAGSWSITRRSSSHFPSAKSGYTGRGTGAPSGGSRSGARGRALVDESVGVLVAVGLGERVREVVVGAKSGRGLVVLERDVQRDAASRASPSWWRPCETRKIAFVFSACESVSGSESASAISSAASIRCDREVVLAGEEDEASELRRERRRGRRPAPPARAARTSGP